MSNATVDVITTRKRIPDVAARWKAQYFQRERWMITSMGDTEEVYWKLRDLDTVRATEDDVEDIIGNRSWTRVTCEHCGLDVEAVVVLGETPDYDSATAHVCEACLVAALDAIRKEER